MKHFPPTRLQELLDHARKDSERNYLMILVGYNHGLRASEIVGIRGSQIANGHLTIQRLKGSRRTTQPLLPNEREGLERYAARAEKDGLLFPVSRVQFWRIMQRYKRELGWDACHPHMLKHSTGRKIIKRGVEYVQTWLGHVNGSNSLIYSQPDETDANEVVSKEMSLG